MPTSKLLVIAAILAEEDQLQEGEEKQFSLQESTIVKYTENQLSQRPY